MTVIRSKQSKKNTTVFLRNDYSQDAILQIIESLVEKKILRQSDSLIWNSLMVTIRVQKQVTIGKKEGVCVDIFEIIDALKGFDNPDFNTGRVINYSRQSKDVKIKKYKEIGLLNQIEDSNIAYAIGYPTNANPSNAQERSNTYLKKTSKNWQLISTEAIEKMGTIQAISNYIGRCVRLTDKIQADVIKTQFLVKSQVKGGDDGILKIEATSLKNSSIVVADDLLLVDYIYSMIKEKLDSRVNDNQDVENKFTFDLAVVAKDFGKGDSGSSRLGIYTKILRISSTEYTVSSDNKASWLMYRLGFVNENGDAFTKARLRWLRITGEQSEYQNELSANGEDSRYVTISLPDFIINNLNKKSKNKTSNILPMFKRDKVMLKGKSAGILWTLNNYLMTMLAVPGYIHGPILLNKFLVRWQPYLEDGELLKSALQAYLKAVTNNNSVLYCYDEKTTQKNKVRMGKSYSLVGSFLVRTTNITPHAKQIRAIKYEVTAIRLNVAEIEMCRKRIDQLKNTPLFVSDEVFEQKLSLIISQGGKHTVDNRQLKN